MQLFEIQGLLAGKCLPGDMLVGESIPLYFLRQFNQRDELARQVSALQTSQDNIINGLGIKGDGPLSKLVIEYVLGLVAENAIQDFIITAVKDLVRESEGVVGWHLNGDVASWDEVLSELSHSETPVTDAAIAEIKLPLAAEVDAYRAFVDNLGVIHSLKAPETDHLLAYYKARGVDELAEAWEAIKPEEGVSMSESTALRYKQRAQDAREFAANLRAGRKG